MHRTGQMATYVRERRHRPHVQHLPAPRSRSRCGLLGRKHLEAGATGRQAGDAIAGRSGRGGQGLGDGGAAESEAGGGGNSDRAGKQRATGSTGTKPGHWAQKQHVNRCFQGEVTGIVFSHTSLRCKIVTPAALRLR